MDNPPPPNIKIRVPQSLPSTSPPPPIPPTPPNAPQSVYSNEPLPEEMYLRWRGRVVGPHSVAEIEQQLATQKIGMLHEVEVNGNWISLREYFSRRDARQRADAAAQAEVVRLRDEQLRAASVAEEKRRNDLHERQNDLQKQRNDLQEAAIQRQPKPMAPKWPWFAMAASLVLWFVCAEWQASLEAEALPLINQANVMLTSDYQFGKGIEAFLRGFQGDPFGVSKEEVAKAEALNRDLHRILAKYQSVKRVSTLFLAASVAFLALGIWLHLRHIKRSSLPG